MTTSSAHLVRDVAQWPTDPDLQRMVQEELQWTQGVDASRIGVSVDHGVVHLDGTVHDAAQDADVRKAVLRVRGIVGIVDGLRTSPPAPLDDTVLLSNTLHALRFAAGVPTDVRASVHDGVVTLVGTTAWHAQREAACRVVERLAGVRGVVNDIELTPRPSAADTEQRIRRALVRNATLDADSVVVRMIGTEAVLEGAVHSFAERQQAAVAAWSSPHVTDVHNRIHIVG